MIGNVALPQGDREESGRGLQRQAKIFFFCLLLQGLERRSVTRDGGEGRGKRKVEISLCLCQGGHR